MKKITLLACLAFSLIHTQAQQKQGKVIYERTVALNISFNNGNPSMANMIPKTRTDKYELNFANNQSLWKQAPREIEDDALMGGDRVQIRFGNSDDVLFCNMDEGIKVEKRNLFDKDFIIDDSIKKMKWKITGETKMILGHSCSKATTTRPEKRMQMSIENGKMENKEIEDTATVIAWFATDIPVSSGPAEFQGQLPGLILEMDINNGKQIFKAINISEKTDVAAIKPPKGKKHYTAEEFKTEQKKMTDQMLKNGNGGIRIQTMQTQ